MQEISNPPGTYAYVIGPYAGPTATVDPGETFAVETLDAFENRITSPDDDITKTSRSRSSTRLPARSTSTAPKRATRSP